MTNPLIHALVFAAAVIIPGGLLVYFAWRAYDRRNRRKPITSAADTRMTEAREAFRNHFPADGDSLRMRNRLKRLHMYKTRPQIKPPE